MHKHIASEMLFHGAIVVMNIDALQDTGTRLPVSNRGKRFHHEFTIAFRKSQGEIHCGKIFLSLRRVAREKGQVP